MNIWDVASGERKASLQGSLFMTGCLSWSPDGKYLAVGTDRGTVVIWEVGSGNKVRSLRGGGAGVQWVAWSPDGLKLAAGEGERDSSLDWDKRWIHDQVGDRRGDDPDLGLAHRKDAPLAGAEHRPHVALAWHPDGRRLMAAYGFRASGNELKIWDTASGRKVAGWLPPRGDSTAAFSPDGRRLAWGGSPSVSWTWSPAGRFLEPGQGHTSSASWDPSGDRLASPVLAAGHRQIKIWDRSKRRGAVSIALDGDVEPPRGAPRDSYLAAHTPGHGRSGFGTRQAARRSSNPGPGRRFPRGPGSRSARTESLLVGQLTETGESTTPSPAEVLLSGNEELASTPELESRRETVCGIGLYFAGTPGLEGADPRCEDRRARCAPAPCEHEPRSLAWSPDGSVLAVGTEDGTGPSSSRPSTGKQLAALDRPPWDCAGLEPRRHMPGNRRRPDPALGFRPPSPAFCPDLLGRLAAWTGAPTARSSPREAGRGPS